MTAKLQKEISLDSQGQSSTCGSIASSTVANSMKMANILVDENIQVDMLTETITYDSDDEMVSKRSSVLRNKKGHPIYSREDIREQYCITTKELESLEKARCSKLFSCFTNQEICSKTLTAFSCIQKQKSSIKLHEKELKSPTSQANRDEFQDYCFKPRPKAFHFSDSKLHFSSSFEEKSNSEFQRPPLVNSSSLGTPPDQSVENDLNVFMQQQTRPAQLTLRNEQDNTEKNSFSPSTEGDSSYSEPLCELSTKSCDLFESTKLSENISDEKQPKHVSFDSTSVVRSNTICGGLDEEVGPMATSTPHRRAVSIHKNRSHERLLDSTLKIVDIPFIDRTFDDSRIRRFSRQRKTQMKTQATQTEAAVNARLLLPAYLTLSPRATAHVKKQGSQHKRKGHLTKSKSDHGAFINDSTDDEIMEVDLLSNKPKLIKTGRTKSTNSSRRANKELERRQDVAIKQKRLKSNENFFGNKTQPLNVVEIDASLYSDVVIRTKRHTLKHMRSNTDHIFNLSFAGFENIEDRKRNRNTTSKSCSSLPLDDVYWKHSTDNAKMLTNKKKLQREKMQVVHLPDFESLTSPSLSEDSSTITTASTTTTLKSKCQKIGKSLPTLEMMTSPDSESATSDFTERETSCSDISKTSSTHVPLLKHEETEGSKPSISESSVYVTANEMLLSDTPKLGRIGHILAEENEENQTSFESFSSVSFFSSPPSYKGQAKSCASSNTVNDTSDQINVKGSINGKTKEVKLFRNTLEHSTEDSCKIYSVEKETIVMQSVNISIDEKQQSEHIHKENDIIISENVFCESDIKEQTTEDLRSLSTDSTDFAALIASTSSNAFQKADSFEEVGSCRIFDNQMYSKDELSTLSEASNETSQADTMSKASEMKEECEILTPSQEETIFLRNPNTTSRSFDTLVDKMASQQDTSCLLGDSSARRKENKECFVELKRAVSFPVLHPLLKTNSGSKYICSERESINSDLKGGLSPDNTKERRHRRSSSYLSNRSSESLNRSEEKQMTRSDTTYSDELNTSNMSQKDDSSKKLICSQCGELIKEAVFKSSSKSIESVPEEEEQLRDYLPRWKATELMMVEDDDTGIHEESYHLSSWIFVGETEEFSAWTQEAFYKEQPCDNVTINVSPDITLSEGKTVREKDFQRRYRAITHRMIHRKASMEMYRRLARGSLVAERDISIQRTNEEFGFRIHGSRPVVVSSIEKGTPAESSGLEVGDIILSINGTEVLDASHSEVVKIAHAGTNQLDMQIVRTKHILAPFPTAETAPAVDISSYLIYQTSHDRSQWWRRWFCLREKMLYWYHTNQDYEPLGMLILKSRKMECTVDPENVKAFIFYISSECSWTFICANQEEASRWISAFNNVSSKISYYKIPYLETCRSKLETPAKIFLNADCSGYLGKLGHQLKVWRRRFFILKDACLYIYADQGSAAAIGMFLLHGYKVQSCSILNKKHAFEVIPPESHLRHFHFTGESEYNKKRWLAALEYSIDRWMKMKSLRKK